MIRSVVLLENYQVRLVFSTGEEKVVDLEPLLHGPIFEPIRQNPEIFRAVTVDPELGTITWPNGADMDPDVLYGSHYPAWMEAAEKAAA
ncbi:MAG: DUF2442 domain-containing protein [Acidobacteriota bacterium]